MLWVYAQLCIYHLATGRNERRRRRRGGGRREEGIAADRLVFREKDKLARAGWRTNTTWSPFSVPSALTRLKNPRVRFDRCKKKEASKGWRRCRGEREARRTFASPTKAYRSAFHVTCILATNGDYSDENSAFHTWIIHPDSIRDVSLDAIMILERNENAWDNWSNPWERMEKSIESWSESWSNHSRGKCIYIYIYVYTWRLASHGRIAGRCARPFPPV